MNWVLLAPNGTRLATGSWQAVVDEGHDLGVLQRRIHPDGTEAAPRFCDFARGHVIAPEGIFPECDCADEWLYG